MLVSHEGMIGRYHVVRQFGQGGMAATFLCRVTLEGGTKKRKVIIKTLRPDRLTKQNLSMFRAETALGQRLRHPNIPSVLDVGEIESHPYLVLQYVHGPTLSRICSQQRKVGEVNIPAICWVIAQIARTLDYTWYGKDDEGKRLRIVHQDVSLSNILLSTKGKPKLIDFGSAVTRDSRRRVETQELKSKLEFVSPEQLSRDGVDHRSDLYALGICLYIMVTGRRPFRGRDVREVWKARMTGSYIRPSEFMPWMPGSLEKAITTALKHHPDDRWQRGSELADVLETLAFRADGSPVDSAYIAEWIRELFPGGAGQWADFKPVDRAYWLGANSVPPTDSGSIVSVSEFTRSSQEDGEELESSRQAFTQGMLLGLVIAALLAVTLGVWMFA